MILRTPQGDFVIDNDTGETTTEVPELADLAAKATAAVMGGYREPWVWALGPLLEWAEQEGVPVLRIDEPEPWPPPPPGAVA